MDNKNNPQTDLERSPTFSLSNINPDPGGNDHTGQPDQATDGDLTVLEKFLTDPPRFRYNTVKGQIEYRGKTNQSNWHRIDDIHLNSITRAAKKVPGVKGATRTNVAELLESDLVPIINPLKEYFESLPPGKTGAIDDLINTITLKNPFDDAVIKGNFKKWFVGTVANVYEERKRANHICPILVGKQGPYKSTFIRLLWPTRLDDYYADDGLDPDNKDAKIKAAGAIIYNVDDYFADITGRKANALKGFLTQPFTDIRGVWARYSKKRKIYASFIGSSNEATFLHDPTGNRRFLPIEVEAIDIDKAQAVDIDQIWAEAYKLYKEGFIYWIDREQQQKLEEYNKNFEVLSSEYEALLQYYRPLVKGDQGIDDDNFLTSTQILQQLQQKTGLKLSIKKVGAALTKAGFVTRMRSRGGKRFRCWAVYPVDPNYDKYDF